MYNYTFFCTVQLFWKKIPSTLLQTSNLLTFNQFTQISPRLVLCISLLHSALTHTYTQSFSHFSFACILLEQARVAQTNTHTHTHKQTFTRLHGLLLLGYCARSAEVNGFPARCPQIVVVVHRVSEVVVVRHDKQPRVKGSGDGSPFGLFGLCLSNYRKMKGKGSLSFQQITLKIN